MDYIRKLIPKDKFDDSHIGELETISVEGAEPILSALLEWIQDINWPVASALIDVLPRFEKQLIPHIIHVFHSDDGEWESWTLVLVSNFSKNAVEQLLPEIRRIIQSPTANETDSGVPDYAYEIINQFNL